MTAALQSVAGLFFDRDHRVTLRTVPRVAPKILPRIFRFPVAESNPRPEEFTGPRWIEALGSRVFAPRSPLADFPVQIGGPGTASCEPLVRWIGDDAGPTTAPVVGDRGVTPLGAAFAESRSDPDARDGRAPWGWVGMLVCLATAALSTTGIVLLLV